MMKSEKGEHLQMDLLELQKVTRPFASALVPDVNPSYCAVCLTATEFHSSALSAASLLQGCASRLHSVGRMGRVPRALSSRRVPAGVGAGAGADGDADMAVRGRRGGALREDLCRGSQGHVLRDLRRLTVVRT